MSTPKKARNVWGRPRPLRLPDGQRVVVRRLSLLTLLAQGALPDHLTTMAIQMNRGAGAPLVNRDDPETYRVYAAVMDFVVSRALVEPRVWYDTSGKPEKYPAPTAEELESGEVVPVSEIPDASKTLIFHYCMGAPIPESMLDKAGTEAEDIKDLSPFRPVGEGAAPGGDRPSVGDDAGGPDRAPAGGDGA